MTEKPPKTRPPDNFAASIPSAMGAAASARAKRGRNG